MQFSYQIYSAYLRQLRLRLAVIPALGFPRDIGALEDTEAGYKYLLEELEKAFALFLYSFKSMTSPLPTIVKMDSTVFHSCLDLTPSYLHKAMAHPLSIRASQCL